MDQSVYMPVLAASLYHRRITYHFSKSFQPSSNTLGIRSDAPGEHLFQYLNEQGIGPYLMESKQQQNEVLDHMDSRRKRYLPEYKLKVVLESSTCEMRQDEVC
jgi:hypothetical protein